MREIWMETELVRWAICILLKIANDDSTAYSRFEMESGDTWLKENSWIPKSGFDMLVLRWHSQDLAKVQSLFIMALAMVMVLQ